MLSQNQELQEPKDETPLVLRAWNIRHDTALRVVLFAFKTILNLRWKVEAISLPPLYSHNIKWNQTIGSKKRRNRAYWNIDFGSSRKRAAGLFFYRMWRHILLDDSYTKSKHPLCPNPCVTLLYFILLNMKLSFCFICFLLSFSLFSHLFIWFILCRSLFKFSICEEIELNSIF